MAIGAVKITMDRIGENRAIDIERHRPAGRIGHIEIAVAMTIKTLGRQVVGQQQERHYEDAFPSNRTTGFFGQRHSGIA